MLKRRYLLDRGDRGYEPNQTALTLTARLRARTSPMGPSQTTKYTHIRSRIISLPSYGQIGMATARASAVGKPAHVTPAAPGASPPPFSLGRLTHAYVSL